MAAPSPVSPVSPPPLQTLPEEWANALSHVLPCLLALLALPALAQQVHAPNQPWRMAALVLFLGSMALVYGVSSVYHALPLGRAKALWRRLDHAAIFVFIAGSYSPFALAAWQRTSGADSLRHGALLAAVWALALAGVAVKLTLPLRGVGHSTLLYLVFGCTVGATAGPALAQLPALALQVFLAGDAAYLLGVGFFWLSPRLRYSHFVWHLCVITGSACHAWVVLNLLR